MQLTHQRSARTFAEACRVEGIHVLPVKGILTAYTLYDDPADRPLTDVDVCVKPADIDNIVHLATRLGWPLLQRLRSYNSVVLSVAGVDIDVHGQVGPPGMCRLTVADMLHRAQPRYGLGLIPEFYDHAVVLVVNVFKDKMTSAAWSMRDLERLTMHADFSAVQLADRLSDVGCATIGVAAADWMCSRGVWSWASVGNQLRSRHRVSRPLYLHLLRAALRRNARGLSSTALTRLGADAPVDRLRSLWRMGLFAIERINSERQPLPFRRSAAYENG
jgi:hypothetical protein